jgi:hypothetical protein
MNPAQIRCPGCNRGFTYTGLSRHIRTTHNLGCRAADSSTSRARHGFRPIPHTSAASSVASISGPSLRNDFEDHASNDGVGPADSTDAAVFDSEVLLRGNDDPLSHLPIQDPAIEPIPSAILDHAGQPPIRSEADKSGVTVIIERFPFGLPGAPIVGLPESATLNGPSHGDSIWAPFRSQRDWEIARWAKMRGPTSSAFGDLLAIPEVRPTYFY